MKRREFLKTIGGAAIGAAALMGGVGNNVQAAPTIGKTNKNNYLVDAYTHVAPLDYLQLIETLWPIARHPQRTLIEGIPPLYDPAARISLMNTSGVNMSILVATAQLESSPPVWNSEANSIAAAQFFNDYIADNWISVYPQRFKAVAMLPTVTAAAMASELERAVTQKGCVGGLIGAGPTNKPLDHADYMGTGGLYEKAVALDVPIWVHPTRPQTLSDFTSEGPFVPPNFPPYYIGTLIGWPYDSSVAMCRMIFSGVFDKYPGLKVIIHHQGALLPTWWDRIQGMLEWYAATNATGMPTISKPWINHAKKFYVDTACPAPQPKVLKMTYDFFGADHILFGTDTPMDYPVGSNFVPDARNSVQHMNVGAKAERKIFSENILRIIS